jgi:hypothetical protein
MGNMKSPGAAGGRQTGAEDFRNGNGVENSSKVAPFAIEPITIPKNSRESLRLAVDNYKNKVLLSCRLWFEPREGGDLRPGRDGFAIAIERLPEIIAALQHLEAAAHAEGLLNG